MDNRRIDDLLRRLREGDDAAFEELYVGTLRGVYAFLYSYFRDHHDAEDASQTVYLKIKLNIHSYKNGGGRAWMLEIAKNYALNELKVRRRVQLVDGTEELSALTGGAPDDKPGELELIDIMKKTLTEEEERITVLHVLWGYKHRDIGRILSLPPATVRSKYSRAMEKMRCALGER